MTLDIKSHDQIVSDLVAGWAAQLGLVPILVPGDPALAYFESEASQVTYQQYLLEAANKFARATTAEGADLDSFMEQFGFIRLPAVAATGTATIKLAQAKATAVTIPVNTVLQTLDSNPIQYKVIADTSKSGWNANINGYVIPIGQLSVDASVQAVLAGSSSNLTADRLVQIVSPGTGADSSTNSQTINSGKDAETDVDFRARFVLWINSRSRATKDAILSAVQGVQQGLNIQLYENIDSLGAVRNGYFVVVIDDGSGAPSQTLKDKVRDAVEPIRGFTIQFIVIGPTKVDATIAMNVKILSGYVQNDVLAAVKNAVMSHVNALKIGESLRIYKLIQVAINAHAGVETVQPNSVLVNSAEADLTATQFQVIRTTSGLTTIGTY